MPKPPETADKYSRILNEWMSDKTANDESTYMSISLNLVGGYNRGGIQNEDRLVCERFARCNLSRLHTPWLSPAMLVGLSIDPRCVQKIIRECCRDNPNKHLPDRVKSLFNDFGHSDSAPTHMPLDFAHDEIFLHNLALSFKTIHKNKQQPFLKNILEFVKNRINLTKEPCQKALTKEPSQKVQASRFRMLQAVVSYSTDPNDVIKTIALFSERLVTICGQSTTSDQALEHLKFFHMGFNNDFFKKLIDAKTKTTEVKNILECFAGLLRKGTQAIVKRESTSSENQQRQLVKNYFKQQDAARHCIRYLRDNIKTVGVEVAFEWTKTFGEIPELAEELLRTLQAITTQSKKYSTKIEIDTQKRGMRMLYTLTVYCVAPSILTPAIHSFYQGLTEFTKDEDTKMTQMLQYFSPGNSTTFFDKIASSDNPIQVRHILVQFCKLYGYLSDSRASLSEPQKRMLAKQRGNAVSCIHALCSVHQDKRINDDDFLYCLYKLKSVVDESIDDSVKTELHKTIDHIPPSRTNKQYKKKLVPFVADAHRAKRQRLR